MVGKFIENFITEIGIFYILFINKKKQICMKKILFEVSDNILYILFDWFYYKFHPQYCEKFIFYNRKQLN